MFRRIAPLGIAAVAGLIATGAVASDIDIINAPEIDVSGSAVAQGWYIRGDLGYSGWTKGGKPDYTVSAPGGAVASRESFDSARFSDDFSYGVGAGYQFNDVFRADLTTDFFSGDLRGDSNIAAPCSGAEPAGTSCGFNHRADYSAINIMANGYIDIGTFAGFTPYVGLGAGVTRVSWDDLNSQAFCVSGGAACSGTAYGGDVLEGYDSWRFTYALMAGATVDITERLKLDIGYRFSDTAGGRMFRYGAAERGWGATGAKGRDDGFQKHEFRVGFRIPTW
ncbi:outer membrane protein [Shinella sp. BYT-45]|uniref:outer membrane protein n=1 Tax=Shinella sp. BYT-45 TaxID=3377377 RepID=UPI003980B105